MIEDEAMDRYKWLSEFGGMVLFLGVVTAFLAVFAPDPDSPKWKEKEHLFWWSNFWFYTGLVVKASSASCYRYSVVICRNPGTESYH